MPVFGAGNPREYSAGTRLSEADSQVMADAAVRANGGREFNLGQKLGYSALGTVTDLIDTVAASVPGLSHGLEATGLGGERQDFNNLVTRSWDLPGLNDFYKQNQGGIEVGSGIGAIIGSELIARRVTAPGGLLMKGLAKTPYLSRIAALDNQYEAAMKTVRAVDQKLATRGEVGVALYESRATVDALRFDARTGKAVTQPVTLSRDMAALRAKGLGAVKGARDVASTEAILGIAANQNGFLYDDSAAYNILIGAAGLGAGAGLEWIHAGYRVRKGSASEDIVRAHAGALDPDGAGAARLEWSIGKHEPIETVDWFGGAYTDRVSQLGLEASILKETPATGTDDTFTLRSQREALATQTLKLQRDEMQKVTTKGLSSDGRTRFSMDAPGYGNHASMMLHRDPFAMQLVESIGGVADDTTATQLFANHDFRVTNDLEKIRREIDELTGQGSLTKKQSTRLEELQSRHRRLEYMSKFSKHVAIDGEWMPISEAATYEGFTAPRIKIERLDAEKQFWQVADENLKGRHIAVSNDLEVILPGGKSIDDADYYDALRAYRVAREAVTSLAQSKKPIALPENPSWFQLDMAEEILRRSDGAAQVVFPRGMTRDSAQVESFIQKSQSIKKLQKEIDKAMSRKGGKTPEEIMAQARVRFNLPRMTAYERGVLGTEDQSIDFLLRGMGNFSPDDLRQMSLTEIKDAVAQTKRLKDVVPATANDIESLSGKSFDFMLDESGKEIKPMVALMRPFKSKEWTRDNLAERLAARKMKTLQTLTSKDAAPLSRELADALFQSEDFHLASRPDKIMETHIQGSVTGAAPQTLPGAIAREIKPSDWSFRDSPGLLATGRLRDLAGRITRARMREAIEGAFGDKLKLLSNPRNAASKMLLNQFHSFRSGWDIDKAPIPRAHGDKKFFAFKLSTTEANKSRYRLQYGEEMPDEAFLRSPDGSEVVLDEFGLELQSAYNQVTDQLINEKNTLLGSKGMGQIRKQNWHVPSPNVEGRHIGYVLGPDNKPIPGYTVNEATASAFARSREETLARIAREKPNGGMGYHFATQDQIREFSSIWDRVEMDMINPGTTAIQPGKRGKGTASGAAVRLNAFEDALTHLQEQYLAHGGDIVETLMKEQINAAQARANLAREVSQNRGGRFANANFRSVHDYYLESLLGRSKSSHEGSVLGQGMRFVEGIADKGLAWAGKPAARAWGQMTDWLGQHRIWDKSEKARKDFDSLAEQLGPYMPFKTAMELAERREAGNTPSTLAQMTGAVNRMTAAITLRILETAHPIMNLTGLVNAMPSVIRSFEPKLGESTEDFANRIGHSAIMFDVGSEKIATLDMTKIAGRALKNSWSRASHADYDFMMQRGYITQEVAEFNRQFGVIETPGKFEAGLKKMVEKSSVLSDRSEDFSRSWGHFIGLEMADILGITGKETRHAFAHDIANKMIANYSPQNRPEIFQGAIGSMFGLFQSFAWNYYQRLFRYLETKDLQTFATQVAVQSSLFGTTGLTGWDEASSFISWASGGEREIDTGIHSNIQGSAGDLLAHGVISQIPKIFGAEGVDLYARGDTNVRVPGVGNSSVPGITALSKIVGGFGEGLMAFWKEHPTLTRTRIAEIASNMVVNRPLAGTIEQFFAHGNDTDAYGQLVSETKSWAEVAYRVMGVRSESQSKEIEAFYADKRAQEQQASLKERLRLSTRAALREGRTDLVPQIFEQYLDSGGDPRHFRRWLKSNYEAATSTRSARALDELVSNPAHFSRAMRYIDMGVSIAESEATENAKQDYQVEDSIDAGGQMSIDREGGM